MNNLDNNILSLARKLNEIKNSLRNKEIEPYNLLKYLTINEPNHSSILYQLLSNNEVLKSFLRFINENKKDNFNFDADLIEKPKLTCEEGRIDLLIQEKNKYVIIIENKVCGASDQEEQLERYINYCTNVLKYSNNQIYVLYLPQENKEPTSFSINKNKLQILKNNKKFAVVDFCNDIYDWLTEIIKNIHKNGHKGQKE